MSQVSATIPCVCGHQPEMHDKVGCSAFVGGYPESTHIRRYCNCPAYIAKVAGGNDTGDDESAA